jgi:hypothetical protein
MVIQASTVVNVSMPCQSMAMRSYVFPTNTKLLLLSSRYINKYGTKGRIIGG